MKSVVEDSMKCGCENMMKNIIGFYCYYLSNVYSILFPENALSYKLIAQEMSKFF